MKEPKIPIMELFGPTIQGEGSMTGTVSHFLRTGGCGLRCSWCDSMHAVDPKRIKAGRTMMTIPQILDAIKTLPWAPYITLTGGDPCLHERLGEIIPALNQQRMRVAVETQGMLFPWWLPECDVLTFSPKGPASGNVVDIAPLQEFLVSQGARRNHHTCIKVVVFNRDDFEYAMQVYDALPDVYYDAFYFTAGTPMHTVSPTERAWSVIQNEVALAELLLRASRAKRFSDKVRLGCQQHVLLWPDKEQGV